MVMVLGDALCWRNVFNGGGDRHTFCWGSFLVKLVGSPLEEEVNAIKK